VNLDPQIEQMAIASRRGASGCNAGLCLCLFFDMLEKWDSYKFLVADSAIRPPPPSEKTDPYPQMFRMLVDVKIGVGARAGGPASGTPRLA
jgi:hypothetical protein